MAYIEVDKLAIDDYLIDLTKFVKNANIIDLVHPVGDVMFRLDNTNPGSLPGYEGTVWQKVSQGRVPIGANATYDVGDEGGELQHRHTLPELTYNGNTGNTTLTAAQSGLREHNHTQNAHSHVPSNANRFMYYDTDVSGGNPWRRQITAGSGSFFAWSAAKLEALLGSERTATTTATNNKVDAKDATQAHNHTNNHTHPGDYTEYKSNLPPYKAFNIWVRIS